jgi:hypothetical protein
MKDFEQILAECLDQIAAGASVEQCLARHPGHAAQLKPLLRSAARMERAGRGLRPSPKYKARGRAGLAAHMRAHPRPNRTATPLLRLSLSLAALVLTFVTTGTAFAQNALPGDPLYRWKRTSEQIWQAVSIDRLGTELSLSQRRADELTRVMQDPDRSLRAVQDYQESLVRLKTRAAADTQERIYTTLTRQQELFKSSGLSVPELDNYLSGISVTPPGSVESPPLPKEAGEPAPTPTSQGGIELHSSPLPPKVIPTVLPSLP